MQDGKHLLASHLPSGVTGTQPHPAPLLSLFALRNQGAWLGSFPMVYSPHANKTKQEGQTVHTLSQENQKLQTALPWCWWLHRSTFALGF